jgi:hypothetical protein
MLPPPKRKLPASKSGPSTTSTNKPTTTTVLPKPKAAANLPAPPGYESDSDDEEEDAAGKMLKAAFKKQGVETGPSVDLFGLGQSNRLTMVSSLLINQVTIHLQLQPRKQHPNRV